MPKTSTTIAELRRILAQKEKELAKLRATREKLALELKQVDARIAELEGKPSRRARKVTVTRARRGRPRGRAKGKTLKQAVMEILGATRKALGAKEVAEALPSVGYISQSKNLTTMVQGVLSRNPEFRRVARGKYRLQRRRGRPPKEAKPEAQAEAKPEAEKEG